MMAIKHARTTAESNRKPLAEIDLERVELAAGHVDPGLLGFGFLVLAR